MGGNKKILKSFDFPARNNWRAKSRRKKHTVFRKKKLAISDGASKSRERIMGMGLEISQECCQGRLERRAWSPLES